MKFAKDFRASAREALTGKWWDAVVAGILASILGAASPTATSGFSFSFNFNLDSDSTGIPSEPFEEFFTPESLAIFAGILGVALVIGLVVGMAFFVLGSIVLPGYSKFNLDLIDGKKPQISSLFDYFRHWKKAVAANLLRAVYTFLWSLLFIIPGIIASYNYAMVPYIVAEDPDVSPKEALFRSKAMMYGNRWRLFCLEISFIGWAFLVVLTCGIGGLWLMPYQQASYADFYREISGTRPVIEVPLEIIDDAPVEATTVYDAPVEEDTAEKAAVEEATEEATVTETPAEESDGETV